MNIKVLFVLFLMVTVEERGGRILDKKKGYGRCWMKVIFLDIDGVLNSNFWNESHQIEISDGTLIDEEKIKLLAELVEKTDAKIVLHSGWRIWFDTNLKPLRKESEQLVNMFDEVGLSIYDVTPDLTTEEIRRSKKFSLVKADEILLWLKSQGEVSAWVVIDDLDLNNELIESHQIKTDSKIGLTMEDVEAAVKKLIIK